MLSEDFAKYFITRERFESFSTALAVVRGELFTNPTKIPSDIFAEHFSSEVVNSLLSYFSSKNLDINNLHDVDSGIKALLEDLDQYKSLKISTAIDLSEHVIKELFMWVVSNVGDKVILDLRVKPYIIGGIEVAYNGKYLDCSIKNKLKGISINL